jgi:hypothetical protein
LAEKLVPRQQQEEKNRDENKIENLNVILVKPGATHCEVGKTDSFEANVKAETKQNNNR